MYVMKNGDTVEVNSLRDNEITISITKIHNDSNIISDYRKMIVKTKWFYENYSHNIFKMSWKIFLWYRKTIDHFIGLNTHFI